MAEETMVTLQVANFPIADALEEIKEYDRRHGGTIIAYDRAFVATGVPASINEAVVRASRHLASRISDDAENWFIATGNAAPWRDVPPESRLADRDPTQLDGQTGPMSLLRKASPDAY